jgi:hypothetical protein
MAVMLVSTVISSVIYIPLVAMSLSQRNPMEHAMAASFH